MAFVKSGFDLRLYLVTDRSLSKGRSLEHIVAEAVSGGVTAIQLREKSISSQEFYELASALMSLLRPKNIPLIINDRLDIALAVDADGLHIGQSDLPYPVARRLLGENKIIGLSVETVAQARKANQLDVDYIGLSPVFTTQTKRDINVPLGLTGVREITSFSRHKTVAIGGINSSNAAEVLASGADGIAVVSAIVSHDNPRLSASELRTLIG